MKPADKPRFAENMRGTFSVYGAPVTSELLDTWWAVLERYTIDGVAAAFSFHLADYKGYGHRPPTPADIVRILEDTLPAAAKARADEVLGSARAHMRAFHDKIGTLRANLEHRVITQAVFDERAKPLLRGVADIIEHPSYVRALQPVSFHEEHTFNAPRKRTLIDRAIDLIGRGKK